MKQQTEEWYQARRGKVTASRIADLMAKTKSGPSASRTNYMAEKLAERLSGKPYEMDFQSSAMKRGNEVEPIARAEYEFSREVIVEEVGFVEHPTIEQSGASPDGLIGTDGMVQIKCPNTATHIKTLQDEKVDRKYILQMTWEMACSQRKWSDFVSFDNRLPSPYDLVIIRVDFDDDLADLISTAIGDFLYDLDELEAKIRNRG